MAGYLGNVTVFRPQTPDFTALSRLGRARKKKGAKLLASMRISQQLDKMRRAEAVVEVKIKDTETGYKEQ